MCPRVIGYYTLGPIVGGLRRARFARAPDVPPLARYPERFHEERSDIAHDIAELARRHSRAIAYERRNSSLRASQRNTVALAGIAESAQMALRLSPSASRSQIVSAISVL
jgi:hypothetical protein